MHIEVRMTIVVKPKSDLVRFDESGVVKRIHEVIGNNKDNIIDDIEMELEDAADVTIEVS